MKSPSFRSGSPKWTVFELFAVIRKRLEPIFGSGRRRGHPRLAFLNDLLPFGQVAVTPWEDAQNLVV